MNREKTVLVAGTLVLDVIPVFQQELSSNERATAGGTVYVERMATSIGGSVGNTGLALHRLGADVTLFSRVGSDEFGAIITDALHNTGCKQIISRVDEMNTSVSVIVSPPHQDRMILHSRGASQKYMPSDIPQVFLSDNTLLHFGYPTGMTCMYEDDGDNLSKLFQRAKEAGITTSLDTSFPGVDTPAGHADWRAILKKVLPYVDIFLPSFEELLIMLRRDVYLRLRTIYPNMDLDDIFDIDLVSELAGELLEMGVSIAVIKCGEKGAYLKTASKDSFRTFGRAIPQNLENWTDVELFTTPYQVDHIVSTNGAGDTFVAGFLQGVLLDKTPSEALALAAGSAAVRIASVNGLNGLKNYQEIDKKIHAGWEKMCVDLKNDKWRSNSFGLYCKVGNNQ